jgi:transposase
MESTGVYWKPVWHLLEDRLALMLVNAQHIKQVPGRKTDVRDCQWMAHLLSVGLLSPSFVPPAPIRELRDLTRLRAQCTSDRARLANRLQKVLEDANLKLASVASDPLGKSGQAILDALIAGQTDPEQLADLALGHLKRKRGALAEALRGRVTDHHRFMLAFELRRWREAGEDVARLDERIEAAMAPFARQAAKLEKVTGLAKRSVQVVIAEVGVDMRQFFDDAHLASWAGACPGNHESAGKRRSGRTGHGNRWLMAVLNQAAWAAGRSQGTYLGERFRHWLRRRGGKKAAVAMSHLLLRIIWHLLADAELEFEERGAQAFLAADAERLRRSLVARLERLGLEVSVAPREAVAA